jgi:hypothetical protein
MGIWLFFVSKVDEHGWPAEDAKWLDPNIKTSAIYDIEEKAAKAGLKWEYPQNGTPVTIEQLAIYTKYLCLLKDIYAPVIGDICSRDALGRDVWTKGDVFFEPDVMRDFLAEHGKEVEKGTWYWHQG